MQEPTSLYHSRAVSSRADSPTRRRFLRSMASLGIATTSGIVPQLLWADEETSLEEKIDRYIKNLRRKGLVAPDEQTSWSVYDFATREKLVSINEDVPRQAASMIKPLVAQAFFFTANEKKTSLTYDKKVQGIMERMICKSSNSATNALMRLISRHTWGTGAQDVERVLKSYAPEIFQQTRIVETIPPGGRTYRNKASAHDYSRFLYALWNDQMPYVGEIRKLMAIPNADRIKSGVNDIPDQTIVYDKTGTTARLCGDMGVIKASGRDGKSYPYTFIAIIEKSNRTRGFSRWVWARGNVIRSVSALVYEEMKKRHDLI